MATRIRKKVQSQVPNGNKRITRQSSSAVAQKDGDSSSELSSEGSDADDATESDDDVDLTDLGSNLDLTGSELSSDEDDDEDDDEMEEEMQEEEEQYIIQDLTRRKHKTSASLSPSKRTAESNGDDKIRTDAVSESVADETRDPFPDDASGSLSPETLHQLGLDELFEGPNGFHSSSEPSFTDFFDSDSEDGTEDGIELDARSDDQQLTTDDEDSESDISLLDDDALMSTTFFGDALAAGASTQVAPGADHVAQNADIPLLVIEDLDGRLIYARAGDGEAVFGSDGEFEFVDDSEDESDYYNSEIEDFDDDAIYNAAGRDWKKANTFHDEDETDEGETTDELPNEDMPFPRLLVGSVAPHGGRNARRARALAARSRRLASRRQSMNSRSRKQSDVSAMGKPQLPLAGATPSADGLQDVDFSISTEDLARDPQATLEAAAATLGLSVTEVAQLVIGINTGGEEASKGQQMPSSAFATPIMNNGMTLPPLMTPENRIAAFPPQMGSFMPTSSKSVHRAVIDGASQAPSPFSARYGTQRKGLSGRKRQLSTPSSSTKRARHQRSRTADNQGSALLTESDVDFGAAASSANDDRGSPDADEMGLDDVMDAALIWRGTHSSSPPAMPPPTNEDRESKNSPSIKAHSKAGKTDGLNLNAVARWHRIPMAAFREGQVAGANHQPLGSFLLARSQKGQNGKGSHLSSRHEHSPFRGRARGASIHLNEAPKVLSGDAFMVSPVLWPTRSGSVGTSQSTNKTSTVLDNEARNGLASARKMTTRREKRERKARKAALKAALLAGTFQEAGSVASAQQSPMLDSLLPDLDFTGASPATSSPDHAVNAIDQEKQTASKIAKSGLASVSLTPTNAFAPLSDHALAQHNDHQSGVENGHGHHQTASSTVSSHHQPPSSVYGMPLHSPLFGSVLNPPTHLGFRDDLDDRDEEGNLLAI
jgi:hypothetical protein